jgi:ABC-type branched-subunit amino acid transport system ATPase component
VLTSLRVQNFRGLSSLEIAGLGRVNLLVGANNVGKTTVLEALSLYGAAPTNLATNLDQLLTLRGDQTRPGADRLSAFARVFTDGDVSQPIYIGPATSTADGLSLAAGWSLTDRTKNGVEVRYQRGDWSSSELARRDVEPALIIDRDGAQLGLSLGAGGYSFPHRRSGRRNNETIFLRATGLTGEEMNTLWDSIALTTKEDHLVRALQLIDDRIDRLTLINSRTGEAAGQRAPFFRRKGPAQEPEPLRNLGDGMTRMFDLALGLVASEGGLFLLDEAESGIHYLVLDDLWRFVFELAKRLNIQVFATTHSADCLAAFARAASESNEEGAVVRLWREDDALFSRVYSEDELEVIARHRLEIR